jgi:hypothetical protein
MGYNAALLRTPPALEDTGIRETPKPVRARIAELERQNGILLGQKQSLEVSSGYIVGIRLLDC